MPLFQLYKDAAGAFRFRLLDDHRQILLQSGPYNSKASCRNGLASVQLNAALAGRYERQDENGLYRFRLKAANGSAIAQSGDFATGAAREQGLRLVHDHAPDADTADLTRGLPGRPPL